MKLLPFLMLLTLISSVHMGPDNKWRKAIGKLFTGITRKFLKFPVRQVTLEALPQGEYIWITYAIATFVTVPTSPNKHVLTYKNKHYWRTGVRNRLYFKETGHCINLDLTVVQHQMPDSLVLVELLPNQINPIKKKYKIKPYRMMVRNTHMNHILQNKEGRVIVDDISYPCKVYPNSLITPHTVRVKFDSPKPNLMPGTPLISTLNDGRELLVGLYTPTEEEDDIFTLPDINEEQEN